MKRAPSIRRLHRWVPLAVMSVVPLSVLPATIPAGPRGAVHATSAPGSVSCTPLSAKVTRGADGSATYDYGKVGAGMLREVVPPVNFDPNTASDSQLLADGDPPPPPSSSPSARSAWLARFGRRGTASTDLSVCSGIKAGSTTIVTPSAASASSSAGLPPNFLATPNWSGMTRYNPSFVPYTEVIGQWDQSGFKSCPNETSGETSWAGIGGLGGIGNTPGVSSLLQAGTLTVHVTDTATQPFAEFIGRDGTDPGAIVIAGNTVTPGDEIESAVWWSFDPTVGWIDFHWAVADTTSYAWNFSGVEALPGTHFQPDYRSTAEVIDERPEYGTEYSPLRDFYSGGIYWPDAYMYGGSNNSMDTGNWDSIVMNGLNGARLANTASNGTSVTDYWNSCGSWDPVP